MSRYQQVSWMALCTVFFVHNNAQLHIEEGLSLVGGTQTQGLVQLSYNGRQGLLCTLGVGLNEGQVICRDLDLPYVHPSIREVSLPTGSTFIGSNVQCQGNEVKLSDCRHDDWDISSCASGKAVFISCQADPCVPSPCQNGGTCEMTSTNMGYVCHCPSGWSGQRCADDVNECLVNNGGCSETCVDEQGGYRCECPEEHMQLAADNHTCAVPGEHVACHSDVMELTFEKSFFPSLHREHLTLGDVSCGATDNATHIILRAPLEGCGTSSQQAGRGIAYKNVALSREEVVEGLITRVKEVRIPFQCVMTLTETLEVPVNVTTEELHFLLEGSGHHDVQFHFSANGRFQTGPGQVSVYPGQTIHGQVSLTTVDPSLGLALSNCSATTTNTSHTDHHSAYTVLQQGCAQDSTLVIENITDSATQQGFHLEAFKFLDNSPYVAFHCDVVLCDTADSNSFCSQGCSASA